ncbi:hypothetical protein HS125_11375 [bacterium]|nr:hypothetical protein [bacterium]
MTPVVLIAVWGTLREMRSRRQLPEQEEIQKAVSAAAIAFGATRKVSRELAQELAPQIHSLCMSDFSDWLTACDTQIPSRGKDDNGERVCKESCEGSHLDADDILARVGPDNEVYVDRMESGALSRDECVKLNEARSLAASGEYDVVVDEISRTVQIAGTEPRFIFKFWPSQRGVLWLVLSSVDGGFSGDAVRGIFTGRSLPDPADIQRYVYHFRRILSKELRHRVLAEGRVDEYQVLRDWSFLWIRALEDRRRSELLQRLPVRESPRGSPTVRRD